MPLLGTQPRGDRPGRGPRALRRAAGRARAARRRRTRPRTRRRRRWRAAPRVGFPLLVRPSYVLGGRAMEIVYSVDGLRDYLRATHVRDARTAARRRDLPRPLPGERDRGRRRRHLRRRGRLDRRHHAARRGGRHPLRRLGLRAAAALARRRDARRDPRARRATSRSALGVVGLINVQYAVLRRRPLRDRGQPARVADRPVRLEGDRAPAGQDRLPGDARREAGRARPARDGAGGSTTSRSRRRCCRSTASPAPTRCSAPRCARPAR